MEKSWSILEIKSLQYLTEDDGGNFEFGPEDRRLLFYDETEAENILDELNDEFEGCYSLVEN